MSDSNQLTTGALARLWAMKGEEIPEPAILQVTKLYGEHGLLLSDGRYKTYVFRLGGRNKLTIFDIIQLTRLRLATDILNPSVPSYYRSLNLRLVSTPGHSWAILGNPGHLLGSPEEVGFTDDGQVLDGLAMDMRDLRNTLVPKMEDASLEKLSSLLGAGLFSDFTILSREEKRFPCHKIILAARSEYFKSMLTSPMKEKEEKEHKLDHSNQVVEGFVRYFSEGKVPAEVLNSSAPQYLELSDYYLLEPMKAQAEDAAILGLTVDNVFEFHHLANLYNADVLKKATRMFIEKKDLSHVPTNIRTELSKLLN